MATSGRSELKWVTYSKVIFYWERIAVDLPTMTSTIRYTLSLNWEDPLESSTNPGYYDLTITIDGTTYTGTTETFSIGRGGTKQIYEGTATIKHDGDGNKTFNYTFSGVGHRSLTYGSHPPSFSGGTGSGTLDKINIAPSLLTATNFTDVQNPTITYSNPAGLLVDTLDAQIVSGGYVIVDRAVPKNGTSYTFELTETERSELTSSVTSGNSTSVTFRLICEIGEYSYTKTLSRTFTLTEFAPILNPEIYDVNSTTLGLTGNESVMVKYHSTAYVYTGAEARKEAYIDSVVTTCDTKTLEGESGYIYDVESNEFTIKATDSRGNSSTQVVTKGFVNYIPLTCNLTVDIPSTKGSTTVRISGNCFYGSFGAQNNTITVKFRYRNYGEYSDWITVSTTLNANNTYSVTKTVTGLDYTQQYTFEAMASDKLEEKVSEEYKVVSSAVFDWSNADFNFNVPVNFAHGFTQPLSALKSLWNGTQQMKDASTSITLSETVSAQPNGIVLIFTPVDSSGNANDAKLQSFFISKKVVQVMPSKMHTFFLMDGANFGTVGAKSLYISDTKVTGYANNSSSGTGTSTIKYDNTKFVLRGILGV